jgi:hypothetical protein
MLGIGYLQNDGTDPQGHCIVADGAFGLMAAFAAWYNALAGIADSSNRSVLHSHLLVICALTRVASSSSQSPTSLGLTRVVSYLVSMRVHFRALNHVRHNRECAHLPGAALRPDG